MSWKKLGIGFCLWALWACDGPDRDLEEGLEGMGGGWQGGGGAGGAQSCDEGDTMKCKIVLAEHEGVQTCIVGERTCVDGGWSECEPKNNGQGND